MAKLALAFDILAKDNASRTLDKVGSNAEKTGKRVHGAFSGLGKTIAAGVAGAVTINAFKSMIGAASDLNESASKAGVVFGKATPVVVAFANDSAKSLGISRQAALEAAGTFGNLFVALKLPQAESAKMSTSLVKLASDLASFNNVDPAEALEALRSGLLGEAEPLRKFGVSLSAARIDAEALATGLVKPQVNSLKLKEAQIGYTKATEAASKAIKQHGRNSTEAQAAQVAVEKAAAGVASAMKGTVPELNAAQKAQAAYSIVLKDTKTAQGDFARTSGGLANQQRIMAAQWVDLKAKIGTIFLPVAVKATKFITTDIVPALSAFVQGLQDGSGAGGQLRDTVKEFGDAAKGAWEVARPLLGFIADHPKLFAEVAKDAVIFAGAMKALGAVKGLAGVLGGLRGGLGGGGVGGGLLGGAASIAKPIPVFVTNAGGLTGLPGGKGVPPAVPAGVGAAAGIGLLGSAAFLGTAVFPDARNADAGLATIKDSVVRLSTEALLNAARKNKLGSKEADALVKQINSARNPDGSRNYDAAVSAILQYGDLNNPQIKAALQATGFKLAGGVGKEVSAQGEQALRRAASVGTKAYVKELSGQQNQVNQAAKAIAGLPAAALKDSDTRSAAIAGAAGVHLASAYVQGLSGKERAAIAASQRIAAAPAAALKDGDTRAAVIAKALGQHIASGIGGPVQGATGRVRELDRAIRNLPKTADFTVRLHTSGQVTYVQGQGGKLALAGGGPVIGPGTATSDSVEARLSNGEYVINAAAASRYRRVLDAINSGREPVMASRTSGGSTYNITVNNPEPERSTVSLPRVMSNITYLYGNG